MAVMNESAVTGPTPGMVIKRRHGSLRATIVTTRSCSWRYYRHSPARDSSMASISSADSGSSATACSNAPRPTFAQADAKRLPRMMDGRSPGRGTCLSSCSGGSREAPFGNSSAFLMWAWRDSPARVKWRCRAHRLCRSRSAAPTSGCTDAPSPGRSPASAPDAARATTIPPPSGQQGGAVQDRPRNLLPQAGLALCGHTGLFQPTLRSCPRVRQSNP